MSFFTKHLNVLLLLSILITLATTAWCADSTFVKIEYGGFLTVEVPKHWTYLDENSKKNMNNFSEAVLKLNNIDINQGNNHILISANSYDASSNFPIATIRLSVRLGDSPTQSDMRELARYPVSDLKEIFDPMAKKLELAMLSVNEVKSYELIDTRIVTNSNMSCFYVESQFDASHGMTLNQTYICPMGDKSVKLATSVKKTQNMLFKPILEYVWASLLAQ
jgi:hypothetical protein